MRPVDCRCSLLSCVMWITFKIYNDTLAIRRSRCLQQVATAMAGCALCARVVWSRAMVVEEFAVYAHTDARARQVVNTPGRTWGRCEYPMSGKRASRF